jgi:RNA polymerase sigma-70 factor (ECF subfamily)
VDANELELVRRAQRGEIEAFSALVERYWMRLVGFARSVVGAPDSEDCVQEAMVVIWEKLPTLRDCGAFPAWGMRIVARRCLRRARKRPRLVPLDDLPEAADPGSAGSREAIHVEQVLARLPPRQKAVMHLTVIEGMTDSEIGAALGIHAASVRSHRRRARESLSRILDERQPLGGKES